MTIAAPQTDTPLDDQTQDPLNDENDDPENFDDDVQLAKQSFETIGEDGDYDMESLLPSNVPNMNGSAIDKGLPNPDTTSSMTPLEIHMQTNIENDNSASFCCGQIKPYILGNVQIIFPEFFHTSGWGVLGPHWFGPACVWLILVGASHLCIKAIYRRNLGVGSIVICYLFLALCTYRLSDVSLRDPGIVLDKEIPAHVPPDRVNQYRFCDRCQVWQPPDGVHCPECNVCVAGYDHHCVWMGTCIGKRNYRQFVLFNMSWLYYIIYLFFWILTFGPLFVKPR
ncbi:DHHC palmitoyltransferase [Nitzschia inconspicua]|uniref:Palmitoyltransferase n=1 Tax=Nitzschia inconspicua TaxID=303405 RepID=A0A9K3KFY4_9STRA|nr:DHHC palmitoyltransferase [Nitzschia inconspicua]